MKWTSIISDSNGVAHGALCLPLLVFECESICGSEDGGWSSFVSRDKGNQNYFSSWAVANMTVTVNSIPHCNYKINFVNVSSGYESVMRPFLPQ